MQQPSSARIRWRAVGILVGCAILAAWLFTPLAQAAGDVAMRFVLASGGGVQGASVRLHSVIGATLPGVATNGSVALSNGFLLPPSQAPAAEITVRVGDNFFEPALITVNVGDTVTWVRESGIHSVTADDGSFEQPLGGNWSTFSHTFTQAGTFRYYCEAHGGPNGVGMAGTVIVQGDEPPPGPDHVIYLPVVHR
ncbi:plastocyanin/azurin family copper-binding protein [Litorilinea aerophila]|nr:plastocyanin/azurin family copper-binding protein [Litorilinea aerophila]MCC9078157.1 plastocyanin/azurin family copper-binding protein [Litorilinea aerophila]